MPGVTFTKFFWADWRSDPCIRSCGLAARGLWMEMLCIAAEATPTGYVLVSGRPLSTTDLAQLTGTPEAAVQSALAELHAAGVFSCDRRGRIFNRRMVRDTKRQKINQKNGKLGGNPNLCNPGRKSGSVNPPVNPGVKPQEPLSTTSLEEGAPLNAEPKVSSKNNLRDRRSAHTREGAREEPRPPSEAEQAEVSALVKQATAALIGKAPKFVRDPEARKIAVVSAKFRNVYAAVNAKAARLDGAAREQAWEIAALAEQAGSWRAMPKPERKQLRDLWLWAKSLDDLNGAGTKHDQEELHR